MDTDMWTGIGFPSISMYLIPMGIGNRWEGNEQDAVRADSLNNSCIRWIILLIRCGFFSSLHAHVEISTGVSGTTFLVFRYIIYGNMVVPILFPSFPYRSFVIPFGK